MQLLPHLHIASHRQGNRGGSFSKLCGQQDLAHCPGSPERSPEWPSLPQAECCVPRQAGQAGRAEQAGQGRQGRTGRAGLTPWDPRLAGDVAMQTMRGIYQKTNQRHQSQGW